MKLWHLLIAAFIVILAIFTLPTLFNDISLQKDEQILKKPAENESKEYSGKKLTFLVNQSHIVAARYLAEKFQEKTGAVVEIINVPYTELDQTIIDNHSSDSPNLDVVMFWYIYVGKLAKEGMLIDLTGFIRENQAVLNTEDFIPSIYDAYSLYKGRRWGLPFDGDTHALFYNRSILERHNLNPPQIWQDYLAISQTITEKEKGNGIYGSSIMAEPTPVILVSVYMNRLIGRGGDYFDRDNKPILDSPKAVSALEDLIEQSRYALPIPLETGFPVSVDAFLSGQVAMQENWADLSLMAEDAKKSLIKGKWGVGPIPAATPGSPHFLIMNAGYAVGIPTKAVHPELAKAFLLFISSPETALKLNLIVGSGGVDPVRASTINSPEFAEFAPEISKFHRQYLKNARPWPTVPQAPEMVEILNHYLRLALEGSLSPKDALISANQEWEQLLRE